MLWALAQRTKSVGKMVWALAQRTKPNRIFYPANGFSPV
jgi:hypothetical protein